MRRADREITALADRLAVLDGCEAVSLGLVDNGMPYVVPMNFGYSCEGETLTLYFHSSKSGRKIDVMRANPVGAFEANCAGTPIGGGDVACRYGYGYKSVMGAGLIEFIEEHEAKAEALNLIMKRQTGRGDFEFTEINTRAVAVFKLVCDRFTGKQNIPKEQQ